MSLPMRGRGLKLAGCCLKNNSCFVAPHAGAWIEMYIEPITRKQRMVAPHAGAWIEMSLVSDMRPPDTVAPHAGAWIEISHMPKG